MSLSLGADAVWVGTRFVASEEGGAPKGHKEAVVRASAHDTHRCEAFTGRPLRIIKTKYSSMWLDQRSQEMKELLQAGILPSEEDMKKFAKATEEEQKQLIQSVGGELPSPTNIHLCGQVAGAIDKILPAKVIVESMIEDACKMLQLATSRISASRL
jgi:NAD(P)H-dependent flavin oxidoreductase YrpB (nitropropane dioxygenase family)